MKSSRSGSTNALTHAHARTRTHALTEPGFVLISDAGFANLREESKEGRDRGAREEKARQAASKSAPRFGRAPSRHPGSARPLSWAARRSPSPAQLLPDSVPLPSLPSRGSQGSWRGDLVSAHSSVLPRPLLASLFKLKFSVSLFLLFSPSLPPPRLETPLLSAPPFPRILHSPASRSVSSSSDALNSEAINN